ncbi:cytochrome b/b6 domain-containing protein [Alcaligenaceae bacterium]|nr:cytochrome b/b6 domain-containing protein [Alcaligenaceae bacterium]
MNSPYDSVRVWDLPTRIFHWALVVCVVGAYVTIKLGGLWMDWHTRFGLTALGLIIFRLTWGIVGPHYARFTQFVRGPQKLIGYLRGRYNSVAGHNPLGALSVMALLLFIGFQAVSGLFANDDIFTAGPLAYIDSQWSSRLTYLHKLNEWVLLGIVGLHIVAIAWYQFIKRKNIISPMIHGDALVAPTHQVVSAQDNWKVRLKALLLAVAIAALVWWISNMAPTDNVSSFM